MPYLAPAEKGAPSKDKNDGLEGGLGRQGRLPEVVGRGGWVQVVGRGREEA